MPPTRSDIRNLKVNRLLSGNAIPHTHQHAIPRRQAGSDPAPGGPLAFEVLDFGRPDPPAHRSPMWELGRIVLDPRTVLTAPDWPTGLATAVTAYQEANPAMPATDLLTVPRVAAGYLACSVYPLSEPVDNPAAVTPRLEAYGRARHEALGVLCARLDEAEEVLRDFLR